MQEGFEISILMPCLKNEQHRNLSFLLLLHGLKGELQGHVLITGG